MQLLTLLITISLINLILKQQNFTANLDRAGNTRIYFILEEATETKLDFSQGTVKVL